MAIRVHHPDQLTWRKMGDIPMGWMRDHIDHSFRPAGSAGAMEVAS